MTVAKAKKKLEHYCAYQERCHKEVREKLIGYKLIPEAVDIIIVHLIERNFLNEERFAKSFVSGKLRFKHWGKRRLTIELKRRQISERIIHTAINSIDYDEYHTIFNEVSEKKFHQIKETHPLKKKKKLIDFLIYRGWEYDLVYEKANVLTG